MNNAECPRPGTKSSARRDGQHLTAFVIAARRAYPVWHIWRGALRARAELRQLQHTVVSTALALPAVGRFAFWNTHKFKFTILICPIQPTGTGSIHPCRRCFGPCRSLFFSIRDSPVCTMDAAVIQAAYLHARTASSLRNR